MITPPNTLEMARELVKRDNARATLLRWTDLDFSAESTT
jgi:hypothetical protein